MFFFNKKKLIEIDNKVDSVLEQLRINSRQYDEILDTYSKVETQLNRLITCIDSNQHNIMQCVEESKSTVTEDVALLEKSIKQLNSAMAVSSERTSSTILSKMESAIRDDGDMWREKMDAATHEVDNKIDMIESLLRLLLMNNVMDQLEIIEE